MAQPQGEMSAGDPSQEVAPMQQPPQEQPQVASETPPTPQETPTEVPTEAPKEVKASDQVDQFIGIVEDMVKTDKMEEERRLKEMETQHDNDLTSIKNRLQKIFKRGQKK